MAKLETHYEDCEQLLGERYEHVHQWLDEYAKKYNPAINLEYHRKFRHTKKALEEKFKEWSQFEILAAKIHIVRDVEIYVLNKPFYKVMLDEIDGLYLIAINNYCHF